MPFADCIHSPRGAVEDGGIPGGWKKVEFLEKAGFVEVAELERDEAEADAAFPRLAQEGCDEAEDPGFEVGRLIEALAALGFIEVVVADPDGDRAGGLAFRAGLGEKPVRHPAKDRQGVGLVGDVALECRLLGIRLRGRGVGNDRAFVASVGEIPKFAGGFSSEQRKLVRRGGGDVGDARKPGIAERAGEEGADAREPVVVERGKEFPLGAGRDGDQGIRLAELAGHLGNEFVRADPARERDPERLADRPPDHRRDVFRGLLPVSPQVRIPLVDRSHLDRRREIIRVAEHHPREVLVFLKIPRNHDQLRAKPPRPRHRHRRRDPIPPRLVGRRGHHPARRAPDRDRLLPQPRVRRLLDRGKKRIGIEMENHSVQMNTLAMKESIQSGKPARERFLQRDQLECLVQGAQPGGAGSRPGDCCRQPAGQDERGGNESTDTGAKRKPEMRKGRACGILQRARQSERDQDKRDLDSIGPGKTSCRRAAPPCNYHRLGGLHSRFGWNRLLSSGLPGYGGAGAVCSRSGEDEP